MLKNLQMTQHFINSFGLTLGISKNKFVVKEYGKVKNDFHLIRFLG